MPSSFVEVDITADAELVDQLIGVLTQMGFEGFWEDDALLKCYMKSTRWTPAMLDEVRTIVKRMTRPSISALPHVSVHTIEDVDWNQEWEKTVKPIQATGRIVIKPTWHDYTAAPEQILVTIDPKMSFGTGYHETTRLVLRLMEKYLTPGCSMLDIGTGTGILAIAGIKLGAGSAVAVDIDEWSFNNAVENCRLNHVEQKVRILHGEISSVSGQSFDLIVANIQLNVIEPMLQGIEELLNPGGSVILSGLLQSDRGQILRALIGGTLAVREESDENEWLAIVAGIA